MKRILAWYVGLTGREAGNPAFRLPGSGVIARFAPLLACLLLTSCARPPDQSIDASAACSGSSTPVRYLPEAYEQARHSKDVVAHPYVRLLRESGEPSLLCGPSRHAIRFIWLRVFHRPVIVRVELSGGAGWIHTTELDGMGGYLDQIGKATHQFSRPLSRDEISRVNSAVNLFQMWSRPARTRATGHDGSTWIFELRQGNRYHLVHAWYPRRGGLRDFGLLLVQLAGLEIPAEEFY